MCKEFFTSNVQLNQSLHCSVKLKKIFIREFRNDIWMNLRCRYFYENISKFVLVRFPSILSCRFYIVTSNVSQEKFLFYLKRISRYDIPKGRQTIHLLKLLSAKI